MILELPQNTSRASIHDQHVLSLKTVTSSYPHPRPSLALEAAPYGLGRSPNIRRGEFKFYLMWLEIFCSVNMDLVIHFQFATIMSCQPKTSITILSKPHSRKTVGVSPTTLTTWRGRDVFVDLGAEMIAAEKDNVRIAVEVKSFTAKSEITELERAIGQYILYQKILQRRDAQRMLFLAIPHAILTNLFEDSFGEILLTDNSFRIFGFDPIKSEVTKWIPNRP